MPLSAYAYNFDLFEDTDGDLIPTSNDFPNDTNVDTMKVENIYAPNSFSLGFNLDFKNSLNTYFEFQLWNDNAQNIKNQGLFDDQIVSNYHIGAGLVNLAIFTIRTGKIKLHLDWVHIEKIIRCYPWEIT